MVAWIPRIRAASASAWAWLPEEWVATPREASSSESESTALHAPRNLNAPTFCRFSHLKNRLAPVISSSVWQRTTRRPVCVRSDARGSLADIVQRGFGFKHGRTFCSGMIKIIGSFRTSRAPYSEIWYKIILPMTAIDEIKQRIEIVDLVSQSVKLRRSGKSYTGFCPFHTNTRTPAFVVFPDSGTWRCFGQCNEGGDIFRFVMKKEGWDFATTLRYLAEKAGVQLEAPTPERQAEEETHTRIRGLLEDAVTLLPPPSHPDTRR